LDLAKSAASLGQQKRYFGSVSPFFDFSTIVARSSQAFALITHPWRPQEEFTNSATFSCAKQKSTLRSMAMANSIADAACREEGVKRIGEPGAQSLPKTQNATPDRIAIFFIFPPVTL
jgi:hypothetical protein